MLSLCWRRLNSSALKYGWSNAKEKKPASHFVTSVTALVSTVWISNRVNSFFLLSVLTLTVVMLPGLHQRGYLKKIL